MKTRKAAVARATPSADPDGQHAVTPSTRGAKGLSLGGKSREFPCGGFTEHSSSRDAPPLEARHDHRPGPRRSAPYTRALRRADV